MRSLPTLFFLLLLFCLCLPASGQNLVKDGGFEDHYTTPAGTVRLEDALRHWYGYSTTPDYYSLDFWTPVDMLAYCNTLPRTGSSMVGGYQLGYFAAQDWYNREYIQGSLETPLEAGSYYYAEVYVKPHVKSPVINWALQEIGIALTDSHYTTLASIPKFLVAETPEVEYSGGVITDRNNWTKISGCFRATGGEDKIVIGNFRKDENNLRQLLAGAPDDYNMGYYFFDDLLVEKIPLPSISRDTLICAGDSVTLHAAHPDAASYLWNTGAATPSITVSVADTYTVQIQTTRGCPVTASAIVRTRVCNVPGIPPCPDLMLPDAFSPNGDGRNDRLAVLNPRDVYLQSLSVYNRWGQRVFHTVDVMRGWDGQYRGQAAEMGVYGYIVSYLDCRQGKVLYRKGTVTLVR